MLISVLIFTLVGSFVSSLVPNGTMGGFSKVMTLFVGLKFIIRPIMTTKEVQANKSEKQKIQQSILCGVVDWIYLWICRSRRWHDAASGADKRARI